MCIRRMCYLPSLISILLAACQPAPTPGPISVATWTPVPTQLPITMTAAMPAPNTEIPDVTPTEAVSPTSVLGPGPTSTATPMPAPPPGIEAVYGRGVIPEDAVGRLGLGNWRAWEPSPDGALLALATDAGVYVFDARTMQQLWAQPTVRPVVGLAWAPGGYLLATRLLEWGNVVIWDAYTGALLRRLENRSEVQSMAWSPRGTHMVVGLGSTSLDDLYDSIDGVAVWNVAGQERLWQFQSGEPDSGLPPVGGVAWSPRGDIVAAALHGGEYALFEGLTGERIATLSGPPNAAHGFTEKLMFSPNGALLVSINGIYGGDVPSGSYSADVFDVATWVRIAELAHDVPVLDARWSPDSRRLIVHAGWFGVQTDTRVWDAPTGVEYFAAGEELNLSSVRWSADGAQFISMHPMTGELLLWDAATGARQSMGYEFPDLLDFAPNSYIAPQDDIGLVVWNAATGAPRYELIRTPTAARIAWSPDQTQIAALDFSTRREEPTSVHVWNAANAAPGDSDQADSWLPMAEWAAVERDGACLIEEGSQLVYDNNLTVTFNVAQDDVTRRSDTRILFARRTELGEQSTVLVEEPDLPPPCTAAFSPDGRYLALGRQPMTRGGSDIRVLSQDHGVVMVYDTATGERLHEFQGHTGAVHDLAWSPDGALLATASWDGTVIVWRVGE